MGRDSFHGDVRTYLFIFPPLVEQPLVTQPFTQLLSFMWASSLLQEKEVCCGNFPIFRTVPHPRAHLTSPHLSGARGWSEWGAR